MGLDEDINTLSPQPNKYFAEIYYMTLDNQKIIYTPKVIIYPNIMIQRYFDLLITLPELIPLFVSKQSSFNSFVPTHGNHAIYKAYTIITIPEFIEKYNVPSILNPHVQSPSTLYQHSVI